MAYVKSEDIKIFPSYNRGDGSTDVIDPDSRKMNEYNLVTPIRDLLNNSTESYVIKHDATADKMTLCLGGYHLEIKNFSTYAQTSSPGNKYIHLYVENVAEPSEYTTYIQVVPNPTISSDVLLDTGGADSEFLGLVIDMESVDSNAAYTLQIWSATGVPAKSYLKFQLSDIDGYELSNTHESIETSLERRYVKRVSSTDNVVTRFNGTAGEIQNTSTTPVTISDTGILNVSNTNEPTSASSTSASLKTEGGAIISKALQVGGKTYLKDNVTVSSGKSTTLGGSLSVSEATIVNDTTDVGTNTQAFLVKGGVRINKKLKVDDVITSQGSIVVDDESEFSGEIKLYSYRGSNNNILKAGKLSLNNTSANYTTEQTITFPAATGSIVLRDTSSNLTQNRVIVGNDSNSIKNSSLTLSGQSGNVTLSNSDNYAIHIGSNNKFVVDSTVEANVTQQAQALLVKGGVRVNKKLIVDSTIESGDDVAVGGDLTVADTTTLYDTLEVANNSATTLTGTLDVSGNTKLYSNLEVVGTSVLKDTLDVEKTITSYGNIYVDNYQQDSNEIVIYSARERVEEGPIISYINRVLKVGELTLYNASDNYTNSHSITLPASTGSIVLRDNSYPLASNRIMIGNSSDILGNSSLEYTLLSTKGTLHETTNVPIYINSNNKLVIDNATSPVNTSDSTSSEDAALKVSGGVSIQNNLSLRGSIGLRNSSGALKCNICYNSLQVEHDEYAEIGNRDSALGLYLCTVVDTVASTTNYYTLLLNVPTSATTADLTGCYASCSKASNPNEFIEVYVNEILDDGAHTYTYTIVCRDVQGGNAKLNECVKLLSY